MLRELGVGLSEVGRVLAEQVDEAEAPRGHHRRLLAERDRLGALADAVSRTLSELGQSRKDGGGPMTGINRPENLFKGVRPAQYGENLRDFPKPAGKAEEYTSALSGAEIEAGQRRRTARMIRPAELPAVGTPANADPVRAEIDARYRTLSELHTVSAEERRAMGRSCARNEQRRAAYEAIAPGLAAYRRDAIDAYATARLN